MTPKRKTTKGIDKSWHPRFIEVLGRSLNISLAARGAGVTRNTAYIHRHQFPEFAAAWDDALHEAIERLEADAYDRARKQSDVLTIFLLKAHKPDRYRDRIETTATNLNVPWDDLTNDELARIAAGEQPARVLADRRK